MRKGSGASAVAIPSRAWDVKRGSGAWDAGSE